MEENLIKEKIKKFGEDLKASNERVTSARNVLMAQIDQNKTIQGAILGLQDLLKEANNEQTKEAGDKAEDTGEAS